MTLAEKTKQTANNAVQHFVDEKFPIFRDEILTTIEWEAQHGSVRLEYIIELGPVECQAGGHRLVECLTEHFTSSDMGFQVRSSFYERGSMYQYVMYFYW